MNRSSLLRRLSSAVNKVCFLLRNLSLTSLFRSSTPLLRLRQLGLAHRHSFNDRLLSGGGGLIDAVQDDHGDAPSSGTSPGRVLHRTASSPEASPGGDPEEGDPEIDGKAEAFIMNFYRQLRYEKQVSLEIKYCRGFSSSSSSNSLVSPLSNNFSVTSPT